MSEEELKQALDEIFKEDTQTIRERMKSLIRSYDNALEDLVKKDKVIDLMASELAEITGSCPLDRYDWDDKGCKKCHDTYKECFIEYFYKKVEEENE